MRKFDFIVQTLLLGLTLLFAISAVIVDNGIFIMIWFMQFFVGCWQLLSAIITSVNANHGDQERTKMIRAYWLAVVIYFVVLAALCVTKIEIAMLIWFSLAWIIAVYYYVITIKLTFRKNRKTYLDVAN